MTHRFSSKAKFDINSIWLYTYENWSLEQADRYYGQIMAAIEHLVVHPESGREFYHNGKKFRYVTAGSHLIFFRRISTMEIEIVRILHKNMDIESRLSD